MDLVYATTTCLIVQNGSIARVYLDENELDNMPIRYVNDPKPALLHFELHFHIEREPYCALIYDEKHARTRKHECAWNYVRHKLIRQLRGSEYKFRSTIIMRCDNQSIQCNDIIFSYLPNTYFSADIKRDVVYRTKSLRGVAGDRSSESSSESSD